MGGRDELAAIDDPFEGELWASSILGSFYKLPIPLDARDQVERSIGPAIVDAAERAGDPPALAVLRAFGAVADGPTAALAADAGDRLAASGVAEPSWAARIGRPDLVDAWTYVDPWGDQRTWFGTFVYPGREPHVVMALCDENLGGIVKDAFAAYPKGDLRALAERERGLGVSDAAPDLMAARVIAAIRTGDMYLDNDWTDGFKETRALILARMELIGPAELPEREPPPDEDARLALLERFMASPFAPDPDQVEPETTELIVGRCLDARCDFGDGDPLRWSPIVVELFMLDFLPRKAIMDARQIRALPKVLPGWVRFALTERGLDERWIEEAVAAVATFAPAFRKAVTDHRSFGPAKAMTNAMLAGGVDLTDERAVARWIDDFNARPIEERDAVLGPFALPWEPEA